MGNFWRARYRRTGDYYEGNIGLGCLLLLFVALLLVIAAAAAGVAAVLGG